MSDIPINSLRVVLRRQVFVLVFLGVLMILAIISFAAFLMIADSMEDQQRLVNSFSGEVTEYLDETHGFLHTTAVILEGREYAFSPDHLTVMLQGLKDENERFISLYVMDTAGIVLYEATDDYSVLGLDLSASAYFSIIKQKSNDDGRYFITDPFISAATGAVSVLVAEGIWSDADVFEGVLVGVLNLTRLQEEIERSADGEEIVFIMDQNGKFVAHPSSDWVQQQRYYRPKDAFIKFNDQFELVLDNEQGGWNIRSQQQTPQGWTVVVLDPVWNILGSIVLLLIVTLGTTFLGITFSYWPYRRVRNSLLENLDVVVSQLETVSQGDYRNAMPRSVTEFQEIKVIYDSFARMVNAIIERDVTLEQRVVERTKELEIANMELASFAYSVSHDLRAPLRAINGFSDLLREDMTDALGQEAGMYLDRISDNSRRMDQLISDLLKLSRVVQQDLVRAEFNLGNMAREILADILEVSDSRPIDFDLQGDLSVYADESLMRILLSNLISNAYKFTRDIERGSIVVGSTLDSATGQKTYFVEDSGVGLNMDFAQKIFEPFQRLHSTNEAEGTGIGLAIVQRVVSRHGGEIWVESVEGEGTTFFFTLGVW